MQARFASGVFLALGFADLAVLNLHLAPRLAAERENAPCELPRPAAAEPNAAAPNAVEPKAAPPKVIEKAERPQTVAAKAAVPQPESAMPDVLFGLESHRVTNVASALALVRLARELRADSTKSVLLRGHTDRLGSSAHNLTLSRNRAETVRLLMIAHGAPGERIATEAVGDAEPADSSDTPVAWAKNRRVQVLWR
jgi:outer membrane protein OmpA-like peptidoglycan-associated protein